MIPVLELSHIKKTYVVGDIETKALDDLSVRFREKEFVAILGTSGSGKTTCLNIIGGLDRYDSGDLIINGRSTKNFSDQEWDAYRNNSIGFVFQSYNIISHLSIIDNVELGMTLSGVSREEKRRRSLAVLEQVGLKDHLHKKPNQLSGGQLQRVAIARALANDPDILLCDEPTGALDSETSVQIMDLIRSLSADRLVIMVTHNADLAERYADRIIRFSDGRLIGDSAPFTETAQESSFSLKKTSMSFFTALRLSFNNLRTKKGRTFLTSFASSIGIIGIAVILSLSTGFQGVIDRYQSDALREYPVTISRSAVSVNAEDYREMAKNMTTEDDFPDTDYVKVYDPQDVRILHTNRFTDEYVEYINKIDPAICSSIGCLRIVQLNLLAERNGEYRRVSFPGNGISGNLMSMSGAALSSYPTNLNPEEPTYLEKNYTLLAGEYPSSETDVVLLIDRKNRISYATLNALGIETDDVKTIPFTDLVGLEFKLVGNNDYYAKTPYGSYMPVSDLKAVYESENNLTLRISGVVRINEGTGISLLGSGIVYSDALLQRVIGAALTSDIVVDQLASDKNLFTLQPFENESAKETTIMALGGTASPYMYMLYPRDFDAKDKVLAYLDAYNSGKESEDMILYTDLAGTISSMTSSIMDGITVVLIAFSSVALVVSLIMICIITYTSVLERKKEIGILKALGARRIDITRVFNAETTILGVFSGLLGVSIAWLASVGINAIFYKLTELTDVSVLRVDTALLLVIVSTIITVIGGFIPALMAANKDAVEALRSE